MYGRNVGKLPYPDGDLRKSEIRCIYNGLITKWYTNNMLLFGYNKTVTVSFIFLYLHCYPSLALQNQKSLVERCVMSKRQHACPVCRAIWELVVSCLGSQTSVEEEQK